MLCPESCAANIHDEGLVHVSLKIDHHQCHEAKEGTQYIGITVSSLRRRKSVNNHAIIPQRKSRKTNHASTDTGTSG